MKQKKSPKKEEGEQKVLKRLNVFAFTIFLSLTLCFSVLNAAFALPDSDIQIPNQEETVQNKDDFDNIGFSSDEQVRVKDLDIEPINTNALKKSVVPDPKQEGKKVIGLFIKTMLAVAFCIILIYVILYYAKKYYGDFFASKEYDKEVESLDLSTPETREEAFKSFMNRTGRNQ